MEMLKIGIFQRVSTYAHQGDLEGLSRWRLRSPNRGATGKARASAGYAVAASPDAGLRRQQPEYAAALRGGGTVAAGEGQLLSPSGGGRVTWVRGAAAIGRRHVSRRPARDVTRGGSVKNKNKNPE